MTDDEAAAYDVVAQNIKTAARRLLAESRSMPDAEGIVKMAVYRRGVDEEFYRVEPHPAPNCQPLPAPRS